MDLGDDIDNVNDDLGLGMDIFNEDFTMGDDRQGSPGSPGKGNSLSHPNSPSQQNRGGGSDVFKYGQEEPGERIEILQQPLALGYLVSTAKIGQMPRWFWSSCPHLENVCPVFLKSALHINQASVLHGGDDGYTPHSSSGRVHSLDSTYTTDVLRYASITVLS
jgi:mediator of RNA polymerase II transcription subunit 13